MSATAHLSMLVAPRIAHQKPPVHPDAHAWRSFRRDEFWRSLPAYAEIPPALFLDHAWQERNAITDFGKLQAAVRGVVESALLRDVEAGLQRAPMAMRLSPYVLSLIDWRSAREDPLRRQFVPLASSFEEDHPLVGLDTLAEQRDAPVEGLTHRYYDKALFLTTDVCPVYCRYCTRSYAVGVDTESVQKVHVRGNPKRWAEALTYLSQRPEIEDVVISGGDTFRLRADNVESLGRALLAIPHVRRIRFATKGLAVLPMKIMSDQAWLGALRAVAQLGRTLHKDVAVHTHFNHPNEMTGVTEDALNRLCELAIPVRNLSVTLRGVNDDAATLITLNRRLSYLNVRPYYQYAGDMVRGTEDLRTSLADVLALEKIVRGATSGHNTPTFVLDAPGGGGKRDAYSYELYDKSTGISVYTAPSVNRGATFVYADPLRYLSDDVRARWRDARERKQMVDAAVARATASQDTCQRRDP